MKRTIREAREIEKDLEQQRKLAKTFITYRELSMLSMVTKGEQKITYVIHDGMLEQWVGIGWIEIRQALPEDYNIYPVVRV